MAPSKFDNPGDQFRAERKKFENKMKSKKVLADKLKMRKEKEINKSGERFNSGDYE